MEKPDFQQLLNRYLRGQCTEQETRLLEQWFERIADPSLRMNNSEKEEIRQKILRDVQDKMRAQPLAREARLSPVVWKLAIAAAITFISIALIWTIVQRNEDREAENPLSRAPMEVLRENKNTAPEKIMLSDGSTVLLQPGSSIRYLQNFDAEKREVNLSGEAFFDVARNPQRPFYVYANNVVTRVLGTSFVVKSPVGQSTIEVEVKTGRVHVYRDLNNP